MPALHKFVRRAIRTRLRGVLRHGERAVRSGDGVALHEVRKEVKRLRYTLEFFASLLNDEAREPLEHLNKIQDRLGGIADGDAFARAYDALLAGMKPDDPRCAGLRSCREAARARREKALGGLRKLWSGDGYPEKLAASISSALGSLSPKSEA